MLITPSILIRIAIMVVIMNFHGYFAFIGGGFIEIWVMYQNISDPQFMHSSLGKPLNNWF